MKRLSPTAAYKYNVGNHKVNFFNLNMKLFYGLPYNIYKTKIKV